MANLCFHPAGPLSVVPVHCSLLIDAKLFVPSLIYSLRIWYRQLAAFIPFNERTLTQPLPTLRIDKPHTYHGPITQARGGFHSNSYTAHVGFQFVSNCGLCITRKCSQHQYRLSRCLVRCSFTFKGQANVYRNSTVACDDYLFGWTNFVDDHWWSADNLTTLCTSTCTTSAQSWMDNVFMSCLSDTLTVYGKAVPVDTIAGRYTDGLDIACLQSS